MEFFKSQRTYDFMRYRGITLWLSSLLTLASLVAAFYPGPNYGLDFRGGTEIQLAFPKSIDVATLRSALRGIGYKQPEVIGVQGSRREFIIRIGEVSNLTPGATERIRSALNTQLADASLQTFKVSPGGDKLSLRFAKAVPTSAIEAAVSGADQGVRAVTRFGNEGDFRYEVQLRGVSDHLVAGLRQHFTDNPPEEPRRVEWVGPKAGAQLRDAAIKSLLYAIAFIMVYVALRFDLRFAPGGVVALLHDALLTLGVLILLRKEVTLTTVAALLTIVGYSINDTIVVYDRIRENAARMREKTLRELINVSTSQTLSRTCLTGVTTVLSISPFFIWGGPVIRDFAFALIIGIAVGTYSSIYVAAPFTEWMDRRFFSSRAT